MYSHTENVTARKEPVHFARSILQQREGLSKVSAGALNVRRAECLSIRTPISALVMGVVGVQRTGWFKGTPVSREYSVSQEPETLLS